MQFAGSEPLMTTFGALHVLCVHGQLLPRVTLMPVTPRGPGPSSIVRQYCLGVSPCAIRRAFTADREASRLQVRLLLKPCIPPSMMNSELGRRRIAALWSN
eukprot:4970861-Prymnesium_polylepis.2